MNHLSNSLRAAVVGAAFVLGACASTESSKPQDGGTSSAAAPAATPAAPAAKQAAPTAAASGAGPSIAPSTDMGTVVFFRESKFAGAAVSFKVREGETELGKLSSGSYFVSKVAPGQHAYTVHSEAEDVLNLEVEAGEVYYVRGSISMGVLVGRPDLAPSDAATFESMRPKLKDSAAPAKK